MVTIVVTEVTTNWFKLKYRTFSKRGRHDSPAAIII